MDGLKTVVSGIASLVVMVTAGCTTVTEPDQEITIAVMPWPASTPIYVAADNGYFHDEGLDVTIESYLTGHQAFDAMFGGDVDFAAAADTSVARAAVEGKDVTVIATIAEAEGAIVIIGRKDRGIDKPDDLIGRRIGLDTASAAAFFLDAYLATSYIDWRNVELVDMPGDGVVDALLSGQVDAVGTWAPYSHIIRERLGNNAALFSDRDLYALTWNVAVTRQFARDNPGVIVKFLRAVVRADRFIMDHRKEAYAISGEYMGEDVRLYEREWDDYSFRTLLDEGLMLVLEDQARWMVTEGIVPGGTLPNFVEHVYTLGLKAVRPEAVTIAGQ